MAYAYDDENIFAKILRGEIPNTTVKETEHTLAFADIYPQLPEGALLEGGAGADWTRIWNLAQAESFAPKPL